MVPRLKPPGRPGPGGPAEAGAHALNRKSLQIALAGRNKIPEAGKLRLRPGPAPYPAGKFNSESDRGFVGVSWSF
jgi:hypothetical protein